MNRAINDHERTCPDCQRVINETADTPDPVAALVNATRHALSVEHQQTLAALIVRTEDVARLREALASLEHDQWMAWSQDIATSEAISPERLSRWSAMWVPYDELTEAQKDMDREWADRVLALAAIRAAREGK